MNVTLPKLYKKKAPKKRKEKETRGNDQLASLYIV
jgi:hypothetical protein